MYKRKIAILLYKKIKATTEKYTLSATNKERKKGDIINYAI